MKLFRTILVVQLSLVMLSLAFSGCATTGGPSTLGIIDTVPAGNPRGWVGIVADTGVRLYVARVVAGVEGEKHAIFDSGKPLLIACPPGDNEFSIKLAKPSSGYISENDDVVAVVPVIENTVTYVGVYRQNIEYMGLRYFGGGQWGYTAVRYYGRATIGSHPLPYQPAEGSDMTPFAAAIADGDWATRQASLQAMMRLGSSLDDRLLERITLLANSDESLQVRDAAAAILRANKKPVPQLPVWWWPFNRSLAFWPVESKDDMDAGMDPDGYLLSAKRDKRPSWRMIELESIAGYGKMDYTIECTWRGGKETAPFGLAIGFDDTTFHAFCIAKDGGSGVFAFKANRPISSPIPWGRDHASDIDASGRIVLTVQKRNATYTFLANGRKISSFSDSSMASLSWIGVYMNDEVSVLVHRMVADKPAN